MDIMASVSSGLTSRPSGHLRSQRYLSQNDTRIHFGLGTATTIDSVEVFWPSGKTDKMMNLVADNFYSVMEGRDIVSREQARPTGRHQIFRLSIISIMRPVLLRAELGRHILFLSCSLLVSLALERLC